MLDIQRLIFKFRLAATNAFTICHYDVYDFLNEFFSQLEQDNCKESVIKTYGKKDIVSHKSIFKIHGDFLIPFFIAVDSDEYSHIKELINSNNSIMGGLSMILDSQKRWIIEYYNENGIINKTYYIDENNIQEIFEYTKLTLEKLSKILNQKMKELY